MNHDEHIAALTPAGKHIYSRLVMADELRDPNDSLRKVRYEPCCIEHQNNRVCLLPYNHEDAGITDQPFQCMISEKHPSHYWEPLEGWTENTDAPGVEFCMGMDASGNHLEHLYFEYSEHDMDGGRV